MEVVHILVPMKSEDQQLAASCQVFHRPPNLVMLEPFWFITQAGKGYRPPDPRGSEWGRTEDRSVFLINVALGRTPFFNLNRKR